MSVRVPSRHSQAAEEEKGLHGGAEQPGESSSKNVRSGSAVLTACEIVLPAGFQPGKGGEVAWVGGPLGALDEFLSVRVWLA